MKTGHEVKEWVSVLKQQVSEIYSIYPPIEGTLLHSVGAETIMLDVVDLILKAESQQEAAFYLQTLEQMIRQLAINHVDVLSINRTGESLRVITLSYKELVQTYQGKIGTNTKNFQKLLVMLTGEIKENTTKLQFTHSIGALTDNFVKEAKKFSADLKEIDQKNYKLARKKLKALVKVAKNIKQIAIEFTNEPKPSAIEHFISKLGEEITLFINISRIHALDLAIYQVQDLPPPVSLERCLDTIGRVQHETKLTLPSLILTRGDAEQVVGLGLGMGGMSAESIELLSSLNQTFAVATTAREIRENYHAKKYSKLGIFLAGGITISLTAALWPTMLPILMTGITATGYLTTITQTGSELLEFKKNNARVENAMKLAETFFKSAKADLDSRVDQLFERRLLKNDILAETKQPEKYLPSVSKMILEQSAFFSKSVVAGQGSVLTRELKEVKGGELLMQGSHKELNYQIVAALCEKNPERGTVSKILNLSPRSCSQKLKTIFLDGEQTHKTPFTPQQLENFVDRLYINRNNSLQTLRH